MKSQQNVVPCEPEVSSEPVSASLKDMRFRLHQRPNTNPVRWSFVWLALGRASHCLIKFNGLVSAED